MLWTLVRHELLMNLMTFRFLVTIIASMSLVLAGSIVLTDNYERRLASYNKDFQKHQEGNFSGKTYSSFMPELDRAPNPLSLFNQGLDKRAKNSLQIRIGKVPFLWGDVSRNTGFSNPFRYLLADIDLVSIFQILFSLLALVFAYDAIAGDRENGTLRLILVNRVGRGWIVLAKYLGAMLCLTLPLLMSFLLALLLQLQSNAIHYSADDFFRIGGIFLTTVIYTSTFYLIGLFISSVIHRTATSLIVSMFIWVVLTLLYPNVSLFLVNRFIDTEEKVKQADQAIDQILEQFYWTEKVPGNPFENPLLLKGSKSGVTSSSTTHLKKDITFIPHESEVHVPTVKAYFQELTAARIRTAGRIWQIRETAFAETYIRKSGIARNALRFSPAGLYHLSTEAWAGTDLARMQDFFKAGRQYRETILDYFYDKKAFSSRQWFASDKGAVRWDDAPRFSYQPPSVFEDASNRALRDLLLLFVLNPILLMITFAVFSRQEV
ncbi:MAG: ABC transporter permease subunit [Candidatus Poribacteria bacterium]|nr:ABC transporter permease subunit [Candidatus Poribacteria bacterium]